MYHKFDAFTYDIMDFFEKFRWISPVEVRRIILVCFIFDDALVLSRLEKQEKKIGSSM